MAKIFQRKNKPYSHFEYLDESTGNRLRIVPERGGLISEWLCNQKEVLYFDLERFQKQKESVRGGIPLLFPICGDLPDNRFLFESQEFFICQHGFARDLPWKIFSDQKKDCIRMTLEDTDTTKEVYPYSFKIDVDIKIIENKLELDIIIKNNSRIKMPFSFGLHPYFKIIDLSSLKVSGLSKDCTNHINMKPDSTDQLLSVLSKGVDFLAKSSSLILLEDCNSGALVEIHKTESFEFIAVWTDPPRGMICIEPWTSPRGALINENRLLFLEPGHDIKMKNSFIYRRKS